MAFLNLLNNVPADERIAEAKAEAEKAAGEAGSGNAPIAPDDARTAADKARGRPPSTLETRTRHPEHRRHRTARARMARSAVRVVRKTTSTRTTVHMIRVMTAARPGAALVTPARAAAGRTTIGPTLVVLVPSSGRARQTW